jgi:nucleoside-diphosphate-sugar epimerase
LAPGDPDRRIQPIDVRDVAEFAVEAAARADVVGGYNLVGDGTETMGGFLRACVEVTGSDAVLTWVADDWLERQKIRQWTEIPLWRTMRGVWAISAERARSAGLSTRPLLDTVRDTWMWMLGGEAAVSHQRAAEHGLDPERERRLLAEWDVLSSR